MRSGAYTFGRRLRDQRERTGVTLEAIAATTKISTSLLSALERGDLSALPNGIFRRAFVRGYATAIGVAPEPLVEEFVKLFPDHGTGGEAPVVPQGTSDLRMTLEPDVRSITAAGLTRATIALLEVCLIVAVSLVMAAWVQGIDAWRISAAIALTYYPLTTVFPARNRPVAYLQSRFQSLTKPAQERGPANVREVLHLVTRPSPETPAESREDFADSASPLRSASR